MMIPWQKENPLTEEQLARHKSLILEYAQQSLQLPSTAVNIAFHNYGYWKGVYRVKFDNAEFLACAASKEASASLKVEYEKLRHLHSHSPAFFPAPKGHYSSKQDLGDLMVMELLPHKNFLDFRPDALQIPNFQRKFAYAFGNAIAKVNVRTGMYATEPHDKNILLKEIGKGELEVKFCDAAQYMEGNIEAACRAVMQFKDQRDEAYRFILHFRDGVAQGLDDMGVSSFSVAYRSLDFLKEFNDIFDPDAEKARPHSPPK